MSAIVTRVHPRVDLTVHTFEGTITSQDIIYTFEEYYRGQPTSKVVWDYRAAEFNNCRDENIRAIALAANQYADKRKGGKSALVLPGDLKFGLGRMYETFAELENATIEVQSFRTMAEAVRWLGIRRK